MRWAPLDRPWVWVLVLRSVAGVRARLSSQPLAVPELDGVEHGYQGGLPMIEWSWEVPLFDAAVGDRSLTLASLPLDQAEARRVSWMNHTAELGVYVIGTGARQVIPVFTGRVTAAVVGAAGQGVTLELAEAPFEDTGRLLGQQAVLREDDWTGAVDTLVEDLDGKVMPVVFGTPGVYGQKTAPGSPAIVLGSYDSAGTTYVRLLIAEGPVVADEVSIYSPDAPIATNTVVKTVGWRAVRGRKRSYVDIEVGASGDFGPDATGEDLIGWSYYVIWDQRGGGLRGPNGRTLAAAGDVLKRALRRSSLRLDHGRLTRAARQLAGYRIDTYCDDPDLTPWAWVLANLQPFLPMSLVSGPRGVYPVVWDLSQPMSHAVVRLTEGVNCWRLSQPEGLDVAHCSEVQVRLGENDETGDPLQTIVHTGRWPVQPGESASSTSIQAAARWGRGAILTLDCRASWARSTADLAAIARLAVAGPDWQVIEYRVAPELAGLEPADLVSLTSAALNLDGARAYIITPTWASTHVRVTLMVCLTASR